MNKNSLLRGLTSLLRGSTSLLRGSDRVLLTTWVRTGYCGVHGRMAPLPSLDLGFSVKKENCFAKISHFSLKQIYFRKFSHFFCSRNMRKFRKIWNEKILRKNAKILQKNNVKISQKKSENQIFATEYIAWLRLDIFNFENLQTSETLNLLKFNINHIIVKFLHIYQIYSFLSTYL